MPEADNLPAPEFDVEKLLGQTEEILRREIRNLMQESTSKKLSAASSRDLVSYIELLHELKSRKEKELAEMSDEELAELAKKS